MRHNPAIVAALAINIALAGALAAQPASYSFKDLTLAEVDLIGKALGKLPFDESSNLILKLRGQFMAQQITPPAPPTAPTKPEGDPAPPQK